MFLNKSPVGSVMRRFAAATLSAFLAACGGGYSGGGYSGGGYNGGSAGSAPPADAFAVTRLVSDDPTLHPAHADADMANAWGLVFNPLGFSLIANNANSRSTAYDGDGIKQQLVFDVAETPARPTGVVFNATVFNGRDQFKISNAGTTEAAPFIFASESGTISAWAPAVDFSKALTVYDGHAQAKVYKGLAISSASGADLLYATDFHNGRIDVFDTAFQLVTPSGNFVDPALPAGYAPFGIFAVGNRVYVSYASRGQNSDAVQEGAGLGAIAVFDAAGNFIRQLAVGGVLNAPWGMAIAPEGFGALGGRLLVTNFGDGRINAFDADTGAAAGTVLDHYGVPITIDGLHGIAFGNDKFNQPATALFFTAGPAGGAHGLYGRIDMEPRR